MTGTKSALIIAAALIFLAVSTLVAKSCGGPTPEQVQQAQVEYKRDAAQKRKQLHGALVYECKRLYGHLQRIMHNRIRREITKNQNLPPSYFPGIPPKAFRRLVHAQIQTLRRELKQVAPINCGAFWAFLATQP